MQELNQRYRIKVTKLNELKYISHLDWQSLIMKTFRRMGLALSMSQGFNPSPRIAFSPALPIFIESECEFIYFETVEKIPENFAELFKENISDNVKLLDLVQLKSEIKRPEPLDVLLSWAKYEATINKEQSNVSKIEDLRYNIEKCLSQDDLFITKINKKGIKKQENYRKSLHSMELKNGTIEFISKTGQDKEIPALRADDLLKAVFGEEVVFNVKRVKFFDKNFSEM